MLHVPGKFQVRPETASSGLATGADQPARLTHSSSATSKVSVPEEGNSCSRHCAPGQATQLTPPWQARGRRESSRAEPASYANCGVSHRPRLLHTACSWILPLSPCKSARGLKRATGALITKKATNPKEEWPSLQVHLSDMASPAGCAWGRLPRRSCGSW